MASLNALRTEVEGWLQDVGRARAEAAPGPADLSRVDLAYPEVVDPDTARAIAALPGSPRANEDQVPRIRLLARFLEGASSEAIARQATLALDQARWKPALEVGDGPRSLVSTEAALARTADRAQRLLLERAMDSRWDELRGDVERRSEALARAARALGSASALAVMDARREAEFPALDGSVLVRATDDAYRDVLGWALGRIAPRLQPAPRGEATLGDLARLRESPFFTGVLDSRERTEGLEDWMTGLARSDDMRRRIEVRTLSDAPSADAIPLDMPGRVQLVLPAAGGAADAPEAFQWMGWALHATSAEADAPVEHRWMGDPAVRAASGWLVRGLLWRERWLQRALGLGRVTAREVARVQALLALADLRAAAALHLHARALADAGPTHDLVEEAGAALSEALGVRAGPGLTLSWLTRSDTALTPVRAAALALCVSDEADRRFDSESFRNPSAARWLLALWSRGAPDSAERMAPALCGQPLDVIPLAKDLVSVLGA
jgi:hypothetical protein